jgi:hypothetical protein
MYVRLLGVELSFKGGITAPDFIAHLESLRDKEIVHSDYTRLIYTTAFKNYYAGLFVTNRDQRKLTELGQAAKGKFKITVSTLKNKLVDVNLWLIHKKTGKGLYQYYHRSCTLSQFGTFLAMQYDAQSEKLEREELAGASTDAARKAVKKKYSGTLEAAVMVRKERLKQLMEELKQINAFEFDLVEISVKEPTFTQVSGMVSSERHTIRFDRKVSVVSKIRSAISEAIRERGIATGRVLGKDARNLDRILKIVDTPDTFGRYDYDAVATDASFDVDALEASPFLQEMIAVAEKNREHFE